MADKQMFKALVMVELLEEEEENKGRGTTRSWLKKREELGYLINIVRELLLENTEGFEEIMRMDFKYFNDITPQEIIGGNNLISAAKRLTVTLRFLATGKTFQSLSFQFRISDRAIYPTS